MSKRRKHTTESVRKLFADQGCEMLSIEYKTCKDKIDYRCSCGNIAQINLDKFLIGQRCQQCKRTKIKKIMEKKKHSYEHVKDTFEKGGCKLLSKTYDNGKAKLNYICECGNEAWISFNKFRAGQRCQKCKLKKIAAKNSGPRSRWWNPDRTDEQRLKDRKYPEYIQWRKSVYERDSYTCQYCYEEGGTLNAHHIESFINNPSKRTDIDNGITLCYNCHRTYHKAFGINGANNEDFKSFTQGEYYQTIVEPWYAGEEDDDARFGI